MRTVSQQQRRKVMQQRRKAVDDNNWDIVFMRNSLARLDRNAANRSACLAARVLYRIELILIYICVTRK